MELKEFVDVCITRAEAAADHDDKDEAIRLLQLAIGTIQKTIDGLRA